jgi:hypothetical protein
MKRPIYFINLNDCLIYKRDLSQSLDDINGFSYLDNRVIRDADRIAVSIPIFIDILIFMICLQKIASISDARWNFMLKFKL